MEIWFIFDVAYPIFVLFLFSYVKTYLFGPMLPYTSLSLGML